MRMTWGLLLGLPGLPHYTINGWSSHPLIVAPPGSAPMDSSYKQLTSIHVGCMGPPEGPRFPTGNNHAEPQPTIDNTVTSITGGNWQSPIQPPEGHGKTCRKWDPLKG